MKVKHLVAAALLVAGVLAPAHAARKTTLRTFAGRYDGHTRSLDISRAGVAKEAIDDGCCHRVLRLTFQLSHPYDSPRGPAARARVTTVVVLDPDDFSDDHPAPKPGQTGTLLLRHGVIHEPFTRTVYCSQKGYIPACGA